jgi:long-chain acyl-CoA synthetase
MTESIYDYFKSSSDKFSNKTALMYKENNKYKNISYAQLRNSVDSLAVNLQTLGINKGDKVAIYSYNRPEWVIADLAILKLGAIVVPIYHVLSPFYVKYILNDAQVKLLFIENSVLFENLKSIYPELALLKNIIVFDNTNLKTAIKYTKFSDTINSSNPTIGDKPSVSAHDIATIVYTSGTTGEPKGAVLTHHNIISNVLSGIKLFDINSNDVIMSYLPLSHMFERTCGYYTIIFAGGSIGYAENISTIVQDVQKIRPTLLIALPRVLEKAFQTAVDKINQGSGLSRKLVLSAIKNLNRYITSKHRNLPLPLSLKMNRAIFNKLVAKKFHKIAGGNLRLVVSGGAPLNKRIGKIYYILGFNICEGYGLTETSPVISATTPQDNKIGTVGKPFPDVEVKIGDNSEILSKGPNLMLGYYNKSEETARAIDQDGWFHTGDQGKFDERGNLVITGRIKELIVTSYGKKIPPIPIEEKLIKTGNIDQVMIYGDNRSYIVALIVPNQKSIEYYAKTNNITYSDYPNLLKQDAITNFIKITIAQACKNLAPYEKIKEFALLPEGFTIDNGLLTPTLKLRRNKVFEKYQNLIEDIYARAKKENQ